jgi:hypothetical protein
MSMSSTNQDEAMSRSSGTSIGQNERVKRLLLYAVGLLIAFLIGLIPMWMKARTHAKERDAAQASLRVTTLQNSLASATIDARRGEYEPARQAASDFFTNLRAEIDRGRDSAFTEAQQKTLQSIFTDVRDDTITLLARSDPASADRLADLYSKYRQALGAAPPR